MTLLPNTQTLAYSFALPNNIYIKMVTDNPAVYCLVHSQLACYNNNTISIYILVELKSYVRKLLMQFARDRRETQDYYRAPHGDGYKEVNGR